MKQAIRKLSGLLVLPVLLAALLLLPVGVKAEGAYSCTARLPVHVELNGTSDEQFTVTIAAADETTPLPTETTLQIAGDASDAFEGFYYEEPGDYAYTVRQTVGSTAHMTYDDAVYTVIIQVTNTEDGQGLQYQVFANRDDNPDEKVAELRFLNTYAPPVPTAEPADPTPAPTATPAPWFVPQTGDAFPLIGLLVVLAVAGAGLVALLVARKRKGE